ncbi:uncharacterized protein [Littorina saxatilis]|uniref:uncharacterized protein n=1 Tax=Littorina saxatilis TaxID=31220 RepID=UPI0038B586C2
MSSDAFRKESGVTFLALGKTLSKARWRNSDRARSENILSDCYQRRGGGRYHQEILEIVGNYPFDIPTRCWSANPDDLPELSCINIVNYFVLGKSAYTCKQLKAYKSVDFYRLFVAGWVRDVKCYRPDGCQNSVISAKVLHSQRLNEPALSPWIIATSDGNILSAHCTCMAGVGETCTHVGALAFAVDTYTQTKERATCTGVKAYWKVPQGVRGVTPLPAYLINFSSSKAKQTSLSKLVHDENTVAPESHLHKSLHQVDAPTVHEVRALFATLNTQGTANVLTVLPDYCDIFAACVPADPSIGTPTSLRTLRDQVCKNLSMEELQQHCQSIPIDITDSESAALEQATRLQDRSSAWFSARAGRITASNLHAESAVECAVADRHFCLESNSEGVLCLRKDHPYFSQVQCQIVMTSSSYCGFMVWTTVDKVIVRVLPDCDFGAMCVEKALKVFRLAVLPELVGNWLDREAEPLQAVDVNQEQQQTPAVKRSKKQWQCQTRLLIDTDWLLDLGNK